MSTPSLSQFEHEIGARMGRGDWRGAAAAADACRAAWPQELSGWLLGSMVALLADDKETALRLVQAGLSRSPTDVPCLLQKAETLLALGRRAESLEAAMQAGLCAGEVTAALDAVGEFYVHAAEHGRALELFDRAVASAPADGALRAKRAVVQRFLGNFEQAAADYAVVLRHFPDDAEALKAVAELARQTPDANHIPAMRAALLRTSAESKEAAALHFGLAKSYEDLGAYEESWQHLRTANRIERARIQYDPEVDRTAMQALLAAFPGPEPRTADTTGEAPIFIVGLPRTGTTLVDRILGSHSSVHCAGELPALSEAIGVAADRVAKFDPHDWIAFARSLGCADAALIAREYLSRARSRRGDRPRFSDKQPTNFFYCPLIFRAFPNARIVHLMRHPLATCLAIYKTRFGGTYPFAYDLGELGEFYIGYHRLMAHWQRVLPGRILDVAYEDVVTALEPTARSLLEYLGLAFEPACLHFHLNPASTATASAVQVRQRLYDSSVHQWRHYASQLAPLRAQLQAAGISVDA